MESKQAYRKLSTQSSIVSTGSTKSIPNQPENQNQGIDQMPAAPPAYPSIAEYQPVPAYSAPVHHSWPCQSSHAGLVVSKLNFLLKHM